MADNQQDILFRMTTEGETDGAEKVTEAIKDTGEAARQAEKESREAAEAERRRGVETEFRQRVAADGWAKVAAKLSEYGAVMKQHANDLQGLSASQQQFIAKTGEALEVAGGFGAAVAEGFSRGGPIGAVVSGAVNAAGQIYEAWKETDTQLNKTEESIRNAAEANRKLSEMKIKMPLAEAAREASALLDEVYRKALRNERIRESERSLEQTQTDEAGKSGVASGAITGEQADARSQVKQFSLAGEDIVADLEIASEHLAKLKADAETARLAAGLMQEGSVDQVKKLEEAKALQDQANELATKLEDDQKIAINKVRELGSKAEGGASEIADAGLESLTAAVTKERNALKAEVDRLGANASSGARASLEILDKILTDGEVRADEVKLYSEAQGKLNGMAEKSNKAVLDAFQEGQKLQSSFSTELVRMKQQISDMQRDFQDRMSALSTK